MTLLVVFRRHLDGSAELSSLESSQSILYYSLLLTDKTHEVPNQVLCFYQKTNFKESWQFGWFQ